MRISTITDLLIFLLTYLSLTAAATSDTAMKMIDITATLL